MQSLLGPVPVIPLSQMSPTLIGGLSAFCINSQIIRLQHSLIFSLQSFSLSHHLCCSSSLCRCILLISSSITTFLSEASLPLCQITVFMLYSSTILAPSFPLLQVIFIQVTLYSSASSSSFCLCTLAFLHPLSHNNDRLCVIVCLSVKRPHHPLQCSSVVLMGVQSCSHNIMVIT